MFNAEATEKRLYKTISSIFLLVGATTAHTRGAVLGSRISGPLSLDF
jgi:hypothetical protein